MKDYSNSWFAIKEPMECFLKKGKGINGIHWIFYRSIKEIMYMEKLD